MPLVIPLMIAGEKVAKLSRGSEAICLDVKQICKMGNKWKVICATVKLSIASFELKRQEAG